MAKEGKKYLPLHIYLTPSPEINFLIDRLFVLGHIVGESGQAHTKHTGSVSNMYIRGVRLQFDQETEHTD
jgi:hypothetical protein